MRQQGVFVNRILNMKKIYYLGLDMDHTLIRYDSQAFEGLVYELLKQQLHSNHGYPEAIKDFRFNYNHAIRGLVVDKKHGNILKLSRFAAIRQSYHGTRKISFEEQKKRYRSLYVDLGDPNYKAIDTTFSLAFCVLYAQLVDLKDTETKGLPSYGQLADDIKACLDEIHGDGSLKKMVADDLERYVLKDRAVVEGLLAFKKHGKKIFILTNSEYYYTKLLLDYAINPFLEQGQTWQDLFDFVITLADKPRFFYDNLKFLSIDPQTGMMSNHSGPLKAGVYQGGCAEIFTRDLKLNGDDILYIGDHIYGDIVRLKKDCSWRTAMVIEELGAEIAAHEKASATEEKIVTLMHKKQPLEQRHLALSTQRIEEGEHHLDGDIRQLQSDIAEIDNEIAELIEKQQAFYNPYWGQVFRTGAQESYFAYQVERYACIYMEKLADLFEYSPRTYFRANLQLLPHEIDASRDEA